MTPLFEISEIMDDLIDTVQDMRESGDTDLRTVIYHIEQAKRKIRELGDE